MEDYRKQYKTTALNRRDRSQIREMATESENLRGGIDGTEGHTEETVNFSNLETELVQTEIAHTPEDLNRQANILTRLPTTNYRSLDSYKQAIKALGSPARTHETEHLFMQENTGANMHFGTKQLEENRSTHFNNTQLTKTDRTVIMELIRNLTICSGSHEVELIQFLRQLGTIFTLARQCDRETIRLILPKTSAFLFNIWLTGINNNSSWSQLHKSILDTFFPSTQKHRVITSYIYRLQSPTENLIDYIQNITETTIALQISFPESELVEIILSNVAPNNRKHFVMVTRPTNLMELRQLATRVNFSILSENNYNACFYQAPTQTFPQTLHNYRGSPNRQETQCFKCRRVGHLARNCYFQEN